jgi:hypothetical protein
MQRVTQRDNEEDAASGFEALELLAYTGSLRPPGERADENKCAGRDPDTGDLLPWQDGCGIRVYYRGQIQPSRLGAHLRVTLPSSYRHSVFVTTEDNDAAYDCFHRGNVCVENLNGTLDADLETGDAYVILDRETTPGPTCSAEAIEACEVWTQDGEPAAWSPECPCQTYGSAKVEATSAANVTFDAPQDLWATFILSTVNFDQQPEGAECTAEVDWDAAEIELPDRPWEKVGQANRPSNAAPIGAGFSIRGIVGDCAAEEGGQTRGNLLLCAECLDTPTCDDLLPAR